VLRNRTVVIRAGRVESIRESSENLAGDVVVIDGHGRYLLPGLIDMHVHARRADMALYRAAGITTVRNMWGHDGIKTLMQDIANGTLIGPAIISASPGLDGTPVQWPFTQVIEDASRAASVVHEMSLAGWSFIKVYTNLHPDVYDAILAAARTEGITVIGHVPMRVPVEHALASGQKSIEHLMGYDRAVSVRGNGGTWGWIDADTTRYARLVSLTVANGVWNCPTFAIYRAIAETQHSAADRERIIRNRRIFVRQLAAAGAPLLAGTDAGIDIVPAGMTLQSELEEFVAAGLSPYRALQAATTDAARFLGRTDIGSVQVGNRADLVLLDTNPLDDISATRNISGVMFGGRWLSAQSLAEN
jgi:imidazolonepropionase-like amidohydrolase